MMTVSWTLALLFPLLIIASKEQEWPIQQTEYTDSVQWDHYSFVINGERAFLFGGEMHPFRIPIPQLWDDILQKMKAMGMNSLSFYSHWGYHEPLPGKLDFQTGAHNLNRLLEFSKKNGLLVTARPGPYINGELNAGGLPLWLTTGAYGDLRSNSSGYVQAWEGYMSQLARLVSDYQIHKNGTVIMYQIENEYPYQWKNQEEKIPDYSSISYMEGLMENVGHNGIEVPLMHNDVSGHISWSSHYDTVGAGGNVDVRGYDSYPLCWNCNPDHCSSGNSGDWVLLDYLAESEKASPNDPIYSPEFQGGKVVPLIGYPNGCADQVGAEFRNIYYRHNIDQRMTAISLYMTYGGTSWGWLGAPFLGTSYDYSAPIAEDRSLRDSFFELKNLGLFTRVVRDLAKTNRIGNSTDYTTSSSVTATELRNPDTDAGFYVVRHSDSKESSSVSFRLHVRNSLGSITIPQGSSRISLSGHTAKILVTDFPIGQETLIYSTAEVLTYVSIDGKPTLVLWVATGETGEAYLTSRGHSELRTCRGCSNVEFISTKNGTILTFTQSSGLSVAYIGDVRVVMVDRSSAKTIFAPALDNNPLVAADKTVLVHGPHLVRTASIESNVIHITGDTVEIAQLEAFAPVNVEAVTWNGAPVQTTRTSHNSLIGTINGPPSVELPELGPWKCHDSLPEVFLDYTDNGSAWIEADHNSTDNSEEDATLPYLYADEYGCHTGSFIYRGRFTGPAKGASLSVYGGEAFGFSIYLNGEFVDAFPGAPGSAQSSADLSLDFTNSALRNESNILTVIQDTSGHDQGASGATGIRGILNATLIDGKEDFDSWRLACAAGSVESKIPDPVRGVYNEGGWTAERLGWHLPGFDDSDWAESSPSLGFDNATIQFYRTSAPLNIPQGVDLSVYFELGVPAGNATTRALLYVNGYQYGRFSPYVNSATRFPVHPGILNFDGDNEICLLVWAQSASGAKVNISWHIQEIRATSLDVRFDAQDLQPRWEEERNKYA